MTSQHTHVSDHLSRPVGGTEYSWCKAVPGGTGITVLALLLSTPPNVPLLQTNLHKLQNSHPILRSKLHYSATSNAFSFITHSDPSLQIQLFDLHSTQSAIPTCELSSLTPFHLILEHEINKNDWSFSSDLSEVDFDLFFASVYTLSDTQWALSLRLHTAACDRTAAVAVLRELLELMSATGNGGIEREYEKGIELSLGIEDYIPKEKANKPFWARGVDMLGYSLNSFRMCNLDFVDANSPRCSRVVRLQLCPDDTTNLLHGCKSRGIKLSGVLAAAGLIAAHSTKNLPDHQWQKYAVITLVDCRSILEPVLNRNHLGFYHSAITNSHDLKNGEKLWDLAVKCYDSYTNAKKNHKHFTDVADLNFLMCKAIDNPGLTPSSALRTAFISVFEDSVIDESGAIQKELGVDDFIGCASVHGIGPSIAIFDTIGDGWLDCACVYPSPLHSRDQMQKLVDDMKRILVDGLHQITNDAQNEG